MNICIVILQYYIINIHFSTKIYKSKFFYDVKNVKYFQLKYHLKTFLCNLKKIHAILEKTWD